MSDYEGEAVTERETAQSMERTPQGIVRRWLAELDVAKRTEKAWRDEGKDVWSKYEAEKTANSSFNILWSNTDTLAPAVFNSLPTPDVRRRFRDADPVGKQASEIIERTLSYEQDQYDAYKIAQDAVLDMLLPGRGVIRVRYIPLMDGDKVLDELVPWEHVQWDEFARGPGKRWDDVQWVAFAHDMSRETAQETFGQEMADKLEYGDGENTDKLSEKQERELFQTTRVWEIWDKPTRRALFIAPCYKEGPLKQEDDPLGLTGFFPMARPAYSIVQSRSLLPIPLYRLYKEQAKELNRVSTRINKIVDALKVRGAYAGSQTDLAAVIEAGDNQMIPVQNLSGMADMGGLEKSIWIMPIDKLERVLVALYASRDQIKQTIYEITGISDIIRGSTSASETATAQKLKSEWGTMRLQKMQKEIQRLLRDTMRLQAEIYAQRYDQERFAAITGVQLPTQQQKMRAQAMMQQAAQQAQTQGQPPPPPPPQLQEMLAKPSWEDVIGLLRQDGLRQYRIDIETDSTVKDALQADMMGLAEVTEAIGQLMAGAAPAVQAGLLPVEVPKEVALAIARRARLGTAVEDALQTIEQPPPQNQTGEDMTPEQRKELDAGRQEIAKGKDDLHKQQLSVSDQHRLMLEQALKFTQQRVQELSGDADTQRARADQATAVPPAQAAVEQAMASATEQTQAMLQQAMQSLQAALMEIAQQSQQASQAILSAVQANGAQLGAAIEAMTAPKTVTLTGPGGKQWTGNSQAVRH
ncbi:hypothetical protein [Sphingopyxis sp.]|uniref:portal protein n=1 Tax=Sphingopyxis sp. TaxID=1908224 RepID=UPI0025D8A4A0|nr:hypothetical protein [Sphingopyxis sp.]MBK6414037.1 hypothetical protein [Sphingopyxis sp.]